VISYVSMNSFFHVVLVGDALVMRDIFLYSDGWTAV